MTFPAVAVLLAGIVGGAAALPLHAAESSAAEFTTAIDRLNSRDPQSPYTLNARLAYAEFLAKLESGDCARLDGAQDQLDIAKASPALALVLPAGLARAAQVEYQLHRARAACGGSAESNDHELRAALEAAKLAVDLYADAFDAVSMVTMQFNTSMAYRNLGDTSASLAALQATIDMDREYGYADDAEDNYRLLLQWSHQIADPEQIATRMKDFPERSATLNFGWRESDSAVSVATEVTQLADGQLARIRGARTAQRRVRKGWECWNVFFEPSDRSYDLGELPTKESLVQETANSLARMLTMLGDFRLTRKGDFDESAHDFKFDLRVRAETKALISDIESKGAASAQLSRHIGPAVRAATLADALNAEVAEDYNLEAGTWIGAKLEQGVWYNMTAMLSLPLAVPVFVPHNMEFTYSRPVPCDPGSADADCIEIIVRAAPEPAFLKKKLRKGQFWSVTYMRLVTDPSTLQPHSREMHRRSYWSSGISGPDESLIMSESDTVTMSRYSSHAAGDPK